MPISFGRREETAETDPVAPSKGAGKRLMSLGDKRFTGGVHVVVKETEAAATVFMYEGGIYAVELDGYAPVVMDRLLADGTLDEARWHEVATIFGPHRSDPRVGGVAVQQDWLAIEDLVNIHQEYLLGSIGAVVAHQKVKVTEEEGESTPAYCSLPQEVPRILRLVQGRQQKLENAWRAMGADGTAASVILMQTGKSLPDNLFIPKFRAMVEAIDGNRSLDEVAEMLALTRSEAIRLASLLVQVDNVRIDTSRTAHPPADRLLVPEAFGNAVTPGAERHPVPQEPVVVPEPPRAKPEPVVIPEPVVVPEPVPVVIPEPVVVPEPVPVVIPEPPRAKPEPEPVVVRAKPEPVVMSKPPRAEPVAPTKPASPGTYTPHDHVRQLRLEVATSEAAELEELLREAIEDEHEALTRTAIIRERLREALTTIAELSGSPASVPTAATRGPSAAAD